MGKCSFFLKACLLLLQGGGGARRHQFQHGGGGEGTEKTAMLCFPSQFYPY